MALFASSMAVANSSFAGNQAIGGLGQGGGGGSSGGGALFLIEDTSPSTISQTDLLEEPGHRRD